MFKICPQATINLNAIRNNYLRISKALGKDTICSAVIKNDAYGLGAQRVSQKLYEAGCRNFWVAYLKEAIDIRRVLPFDAKIYFLQGFWGSDL
ncbi:MAG: alanine racemase, partial [Holosporales bacterium]|nr:alanine racemase [Holosporales bacterium]